MVTRLLVAGISLPATMIALAVGIFIGGFGFWAEIWAMDYFKSKDQRGPAVLMLVLVCVCLFGLPATTWIAFGFWIFLAMTVPIVLGYALHCGAVYEFNNTRPDETPHGIIDSL
jgi:hypothetical protein